MPIRARQIFGRDYVVKVHSWGGRKGLLVPPPPGSPPAFGIGSDHNPE